MPQKIDALANALNKKDYQKLEQILMTFHQTQELLKEKNIPHYKLNLESLSSCNEQLLCKAVMLQDYKACLLLLQYGASIQGIQPYSATAPIKEKEIEIEKFLRSFESVSNKPIEKIVKKPTALDYALRNADLSLIKLLLLNDDASTTTHLQKVLTLNEWDEASQNKIRNRKDYAGLVKMVECFKYIKQGFHLSSANISISDRTRQDTYILNSFTQALQLDVLLTLECLEACIKALNCISQGLLPETRLIQYDSSKTSASLRILIHVVVCYFGIAYAHENVSKENSTRFNQMLIDLLALQQNLKHNEKYKVSTPFDSDQSAREFVLFHLRDAQLKTTLQTMNSSAGKQILILFSCLKHFLTNRLLM